MTEPAEPAEPAEPDTLTATTRVFDLPGIGAITATISASDDTGTVVYRLRGPRITGALSIGIGDPLAIKTPDTFAYAFGIRGERWWTSWPERLTVNGVALAGDYTISLADLEESPRRLRIERPDRYLRGDAPRATVARATPVVAAVLRDFSTRADLAALWRTAARLSAKSLLPGCDSRIRDAREKMSEAAIEYHLAIKTAEALETIAGPEELTEPPARMLA